MHSFVQSPAESCNKQAVLKLFLAVPPWHHPVSTITFIQQTIPFRGEEIPAQNSYVCSQGTALAKAGPLSPAEGSILRSSQSGLSSGPSAGPVGQVKACRLGYFLIFPRNAGFSLSWSRRYLLTKAQTEAGKATDMPDSCFTYFRAAVLEPCPDLSLWTK